MFRRGKRDKKEGRSANRHSNPPAATVDAGQEEVAATDKTGPALLVAEGHSLPIKKHLRPNFLRRVGSVGELPNEIPFDKGPDSPSPPSLSKNTARSSPDVDVVPAKPLSRRLKNRGRQATRDLTFQLVAGSDLDDLMSMHEFLMSQLHTIETSHGHGRATTVRVVSGGASKVKSTQQAHERLLEEISAVEEQIRLFGGTPPSAPSTKSSPNSSFGLKKSGTVRSPVSTLFGPERVAAASAFAGDSHKQTLPSSRPTLAELAASEKRDDVNRSLTDFQRAIADLGEPTKFDHSVSLGTDIADLINAVRGNYDSDQQDFVQRLESQMADAAADRQLAELEAEQERERVQKANENVARLMQAIEEYQESMEETKFELLQRVSELSEENENLKEEMDGLRKRMNAKVMEMHSRNVEMIEMLSSELEAVEEMNQNLEAQLEMERDKRKALASQLQMQADLTSLVEQQAAMDIKFANMENHYTDSSDHSMEEGDNNEETGDNAQGAQQQATRRREPESKPFEQSIDKPPLPSPQPPKPKRTVSPRKRRPAVSETEVDVRR